jgi:hypothetical protein
VARPVYSTLLASATSVPDSSTNLGSPPIGDTWVVRFLAATFGSYLGYARFGVSLTGLDPWLWLCTSLDANIIGVTKRTFVWEGRLVVPDGLSLYGMCSDGDSCDVIASGYTLTAS